MACEHKIDANKRRVIHFIARLDAIRVCACLLRKVCSVQRLHKFKVIHPPGNWQLDGAAMASMAPRLIAQEHVGRSSFFCLSPPARPGWLQSWLICASPLTSSTSMQTQSNKVGPVDRLHTHSHIVQWWVRPCAKCALCAHTE